MKPLRVLVVDDSLIQRTLISQWITADASMVVVGLAATGTDALRMTQDLRPDVIALDLMMPDMDGLQTTERIMHETPTPIVLLTSQEASVALNRSAQNSGAITVFLKPRPDDAPQIQRFRETLKTVAKIRMVRRSQTRVVAPVASGKHQVVLVGSSTGGPPVLETLLSGLPAHFPLPVVIVQHISPGFEASLIGWLQTTCKLPISMAQQGMVLKPGVYLAPTGHHLELDRQHGKLCLKMTDAPAEKGHRPSANVLFHSAVKLLGGNLIALLLTGMGEDGATGLQAIREAGGVTIAQNRESSVVFGMPQAAIKLGAAQHVLAPEEMPAKLKEVLRL